MLLFVAVALLSACAAAPPRTVVFVCEHGAAKSVLAAAYLNRMADERGLAVRAVARGADPQPNPSARTVEGLRADGLPAPAVPPEPLTASDVRAAARLVVFDCREPTMVALSRMGACWDDVPAVGDGYPRARDGIRARVDGLLAELSR
ncbi:MAG TPA: hypothetical protein VKE22_12815 [Haliangiales bacterium]|nr:hypothetical protein [Haliangiales bacterium]